MKVPAQQSSQTESIIVTSKEIKQINIDEHKDELQTKNVVEEFFQILSGEKDGDLISLFADNVDFNLAGNEEKFPWVGKRTTKKEVEEYFETLYQNIKPKTFEIEFIAISCDNAVAVGHLSSVILKYNKIFDTQFATIFKVQNAKIVKYHFMEDSYRLNKEME